MNGIFNRKMSEIWIVGKNEKKKEVFFFKKKNRAQTGKFGNRFPQFPFSVFLWVLRVFYLYNNVFFRDFSEFSIKMKNLYIKIPKNTINTK
jgi:hypothetical protein